MSSRHDDAEGVTLQDLLEDGRFDDAEVLAGLAENQGVPWAASLRALCLFELGRKDEALAAAERGLSSDPSSALAHWAMGAIRCDRNHLGEAEAAAGEAIRLDPDDPRNRALLAQVHAKRGEWQACREAAEAGLALDATDEACAALRVLALGQAVSGEDWSQELDDLIGRFPASGWVRAGKGWSLLETGHAEEARASFEQALALDPTSDWARHGLVESVKAQNPLYSAILQFFLWLDRLPARTRWTYIIGGWFVYRFTRVFARDNPELAPLTYPIVAAWLFFILASWTSAPLSNFILSRSHVGRRLVRGEELVAANVVAGILGLALAMTLVAMATGSERAILGALAFGFLIIPAAGVFHCAVGWPRKVMAVYTALTSLAAVTAIVAPMEMARVGAIVALLAAVLGSWLGSFLATRVART